MQAQNETAARTTEAKIYLSKATAEMQFSCIIPLALRRAEKRV